MNRLFEKFNLWQQIIFLFFIILILCVTLNYIVIQQYGGIGKKHYNQMCKYCTSNIEIQKNLLSYENKTKLTVLDRNSDLMEYPELDILVSMGYDAYINKPGYYISEKEGIYYYSNNNNLLMIEKQYPKVIFNKDSDVYTCYYSGIGKLVASKYTDISKERDYIFNASGAIVYRIVYSHFGTYKSKRLAQYVSK